MASNSDAFRRLTLLRGGLRRLQGGRVVRKVNKAIAGVALELVHEGIEAKADPYGRTWKPLKDRSGEPLRDTGRLYNSLSIRSGGGGFTLQTNVAYAAYHQLGTKRIPRRPYFPDGRGVPTKWRAEFKAAAEEALLSEVPR